MADTFWSDYSWIIRGKQRRKVIEILDKPKMATELKREAQIALTNASRVLVQFEKKGIAKCLTPEEDRCRVYELTKKGKLVREELLKRK